MEIDKDGRGKGTMSYATKIIPAGDTIVLEDDLRRNLTSDDAFEQRGHGAPFQYS